MVALQDYVDPVDFNRPAMEPSISSMVGNYLRGLGISSVYIAGPMRGYPGLNFDAFNKESALLGEMGINVYSPVDISTAIGHQAGVDASQDNDITRYFRADINAIMEADAVIVLPGFQNSVGALTEITVAILSGKKVLRSGTYEVIPFDAASITAKDGVITLFDPQDDDGDDDPQDGDDDGEPYDDDDVDVRDDDYSPDEDYVEQVKRASHKGSFVSNTNDTVLASSYQDAYEYGFSDGWSQGKMQAQAPSGPAKSYEQGLYDGRKAGYADGYHDCANSMVQLDMVEGEGKSMLSQTGGGSKKMPGGVPTILDIAAGLVDGDRQSTYGHPADDFSGTASWLSQHLQTPVHPMEIAMMMIAVKLSRLKNGYHKDSVVDIAGYARTIEKVQDRVESGELKPYTGRYKNPSTDPFSFLGYPDIPF